MGIVQVNHQGMLDLINRGAQIVDVLPEREYRGFHIKEAIHLPLPRLFGDAHAKLTDNRPVAVYCRDAL